MIYQEIPSFKWCWVKIEEIEEVDFHLTFILLFLLLLVAV